MNAMRMDKIKIIGVFKVTRADKQTRKIWSEAEDIKLLRLIDNYQDEKIKWNDVGTHLNKTANQCYSRYRQINPTLNKGFWTKEEETHLINLVAKYGRKWASISKIFKTRSGKQIRSHYLNITDPDNLRKPFTREEDDIIIEQFFRVGPKWQIISQHVRGRTGDIIKSRYYNALKSRIENELLNKIINNTGTSNSNNSNKIVNNNNCNNIVKTEVSEQSPQLNDYISKILNNNKKENNKQFNFSSSESIFNVDDNFHSKNNNNLNSFFDKDNIKTNYNSIKNMFSFSSINNNNNCHFQDTLMKSVNSLIITISPNNSKNNHNFNNKYKERGNFFI
jgi:Myb-like DNA-binding protein BAS1